MTCDSSELFTLFFRELERRNIPFVILHSYQDLRGQLSSDIDYAVAGEHLASLRGIQCELARRHGWALVQTLQHGVFAFYAVLVNLARPGEFLKLDACSTYARARRLLVPENILLMGRQPYRGFFIPAPAAEFIYVLAKTFDAKGKSPAKYLPRLKELWEQDRTGAQKNFTRVFGDTGRTLEQWFTLPAEDWRQLGGVMLARNRFGPALMLRESARVARRVFQPTGFSLTVMGSDGSGKSTLLLNLQTLLEPCFRQQKFLHFRPNVLGKRTRDDAASIADPHGRPPKSAFSSCLRVGYYFADHWLGWVLITLPARVRSTLVLFDRNFEDMLVDQKRYRLQEVSWLVRVLRCFVPGTDRIFVLTAPAELLHQRKPELTVAELARQQQELQELAHQGKKYVAVSADQSPEQVAGTVWREVVTLLAAREEKRV